MMGEDFGGFFNVPHEDLAETFEDLNSNLSRLRRNMDGLKERMIRQFYIQQKAYLTFQCFLITINFVFIPALAAIGLKCILMELVGVELQGLLQVVIQVLWFLSGCLGGPLYLESIWTIYNIPDPEEADKELVSFQIDEELRRIFPFLFAEEENEGNLPNVWLMVHVNNGNQGGEDEHDDAVDLPNNQIDANEVDGEEDDAVDLPNNQIDANEVEGEEDDGAVHASNNPGDVQNIVDLQPESPPVRDPASMYSIDAVEEQADNTADADDNTPRPLSSDQPIIPDTAP